MSIFRSLIVILFGLGLFVQGAAQASAMPLPQSALSDCAEMMKSMGEPAGADKPAESDIPCEKMSLDCLIAMGCVGATLLTEFRASDAAIAAIGDRPQPEFIAGLYGRLILPESPPPQTNFTA